MITHHFQYSKDSISKYMMSKLLPIDKLPIDVESGFQIVSLFYLCVYLYIYLRLLYFIYVLMTF